MQNRFMCIWFRHLTTDWFIRRLPLLRNIPFVLASPDHGRMVVTAANVVAENEGVFQGMSVADARAIIPSLEVQNDNPDYAGKLLKNLAEWLIRYTPVVAIDLPDSLLLDITGCAHLWGSEKQYLNDISTRLQTLGYQIQTSIADTIGTAWAMAHATHAAIIETGKQLEALLVLPPASLRIDRETAERLEKLGLRQIKDFIHMPRTALRRRFGMQLLQRLHQALGNEAEWITPVQPIEPYQHRLPCIEPIVTATGIEIALQLLLDEIGTRLQKEGKGLRTAIFKGYRTDGTLVQVEIGTNRPSCNAQHLFKLFENKITCLEPAGGIELFTLDAAKVEDLFTMQEKLWDNKGGLDDIHLAELLDRIENKVGTHHIHRFLPDEHYWPERSFKPALELDETPQISWNAGRPRPVQLLVSPQIIEVTAPIPDYPPMLFRYKGKLHKITKADGPERIEQEWWLQDGQHRDYYTVEDEEGKRYWLFRSGHYDTSKSHQWFIHGFFA